MENAGGRIRSYFFSDIYGVHCGTLQDLIESAFQLGDPFFEGCPLSGSGPDHIFGAFDVAALTAAGDLVLSSSEGSASGRYQLARQHPLPNNPPAAAGDTYTTVRNRSLMVDAAEGVLANDTDIEGDSLSAELADEPANGALSLEPDGGFTYTPDQDFNGVDSFTYRASDGLATRSNRQLEDSQRVEFLIQADEDCLIGLDRWSSDTN